MPISEPVSEYMSAPVRSVLESTAVDEAERRMSEHRISSLAVVDAVGRLAGVITRFDLLRLGRLRARTARGETLLDLPERPVARAMHRPAVAVAPEATVAEACRLMVDGHIHRVFVARDSRPVGVLSTRDVMRAIVNARIDTPVDRFMAAPVVTVSVDDTIAAATDRLAESRVSGVVVVEGTWPVGLFTQAEALEAGLMPAETRVEAVMSYSLVCLPPATPLFRAAGYAAASRARRVLVVDHRQVTGILTGIDLARAAA